MKESPNTPPNTCIPCVLLFQPNARLNDIRKRIGEADTFLASLDRTLDQAAERNAAVSATPFYDAWHQVRARVSVVRNATQDELNAFLDGNTEEANSCRWRRDITAHAILERMDAFEEELARFAAEN